MPAVVIIPLLEGIDRDRDQHQHQHSGLNEEACQQEVSNPRFTVSLFSFSNCIRSRLLAIVAAAVTKIIILQLPQNHVPETIACQRTAEMCRVADCALSIGHRA